MWELFAAIYNSVLTREGLYAALLLVFVGWFLWNQKKENDSNREFKVQLDKSMTEMRTLIKALTQSLGSHSRDCANDNEETCRAVAECTHKVDLLSKTVDSLESLIQNYLFSKGGGK